MIMSSPNLSQPNFSQLKTLTGMNDALLLEFTAKMSILKNFKSAPVKRDEELPQPSSSLSNVMPHKLLYS